MGNLPSFSISEQQPDSQLVPGYAGSVCVSSTQPLTDELVEMQQQDHLSTSRLNHQPQFRTLGKDSLECTYDNCGTPFRRHWDLKRHHTTVHLRVGTFFCGFNGCARRTRGFSRKDKRDEHERHAHGERRNQASREAPTNSVDGSRRHCARRRKN